MEAAAVTPRSTRLHGVDGASRCTLPGARLACGTVVRAALIGLPECERCFIDHLDPVLKGIHSTGASSVRIRCCKRRRPIPYVLLHCFVSFFRGLSWQVIRPVRPLGLPCAPEFFFFSQSAFLCSDRCFPPGSNVFKPDGFNSCGYLGGSRAFAARRLESCPFLVERSALACRSLSWRQISSVQRHNGPVTGLQFNPHKSSSHLLASGGADNEVFIMALERPEAPNVFVPGPKPNTVRELEGGVARGLGGRLESLGAIRWELTSESLGGCRVTMGRKGVLGNSLGCFRCRKK